MNLHLWVWWFLHCWDTVSCCRPGQCSYSQSRQRPQVHQTHTNACPHWLLQHHDESMSTRYHQSWCIENCLVLFGKCNRKNSKCNVTLSIFYCYFYGRRYSQDRSSYHSWVRASNSPYSWPIVMDLGLSTNVCVAVNIKPAGDSWPTRADWAAFNTS